MGVRDFSYLKEERHKIMAKAKTKKPTRKRQNNVYIISKTMLGLKEPQPEYGTRFSSFADAKSEGRKLWPTSSFWIGTVDKSLRSELVEMDYSQAILDHADLHVSVGSGFVIPDDIQSLVRLTQEERNTLNGCVHLALGEKWKQIPDCYTFLNRQKIEPLKKKRASTKERKTA